MTRAIFVCGIAAVLCCGAARAQSGGLPPDWEVRKDLEELAGHVAKLKPILEQARPATWQGAPAAYAEQGKEVGNQLDYLVTTSGSLAKQPAKLTLALSMFFRMQALDAMIRSYAEGIRKYQNPALADLLHGALPALNADRDKLRQYVLDLAADQEQAFRLADAEAQRCRAGVPRKPRK